MKTLTLKKHKLSYQFKVSPELLGSCSLLLMLCGDIVWTVIYHAGQVVGLGEENKTIILALQSVITLFPCFLSAVICHKVKRSGFFILFSICLMLFFLSAGIHPEYYDMIFIGEWNIWMTIFAPSCGIWMFLYIQLCENSDRVLQTMVLAAKINLVYACMRFARVLLVGNTVYFRNTGQTFSVEYDVGLGYLGTFCAAIFLYKWLQKGNKIDIVCLILSVTIVIAGGSRTPFGLLFIFFVVFAFEFRDRILKNKIVIAVCSLAVGILIAIVTFFKDIQPFLSGVLEKYDIHSRTLSLLFSGNIMWDNGRDALKDIAKEMIDEGGFFGYGVYGDRYFISQINPNAYPHNIYYEMAVQFGPTLAVILLIFIAVLVIATLQSCKDKYFRIVYLIFFVFSCALFIEDSFWYNKYFWGLLGLTAFYWRNMRTELICRKINRINTLNQGEDVR